MKNIVRLGMFETNSSSMHSIILSPVEKVPYGEQISNDFLDNWWVEDGELSSATIFLNEAHVEYGRQAGSILIGTEDKLTLYVSLILSNIIRDFYKSGIKGPIKKKVKKLFNERIEKLNKEFFNKLGIELRVVLPKMKDVKNRDISSYYLEIKNQPYIEDSYDAFDKLLDLIDKDYSNLYSFLYSPKSFVILAGDEYDTSFALEDLIRPSLSEDVKILGHIRRDKDEQ